MDNVIDFINVNRERYRQYFSAVFSDFHLFKSAALWACSFEDMAMIFMYCTPLAADCLSASSFFCCKSSTWNSNLSTSFVNLALSSAKLFISRSDTWDFFSRVAQRI